MALMLGLNQLKAQQAAEDSSKPGSKEEQLEADIDPSSAKKNNETEVDLQRLQKISIMTSDERCNDKTGECRDLDYGNPEQIVFFEVKPQIRFTSETTYVVRDSVSFESLKFMNSKFSRFPLNLFYAFKPKELDMRNVSMQTMSWDNFLMAEQLAILLLSDNQLKHISSRIFEYCDNLMFLFLDSNQLQSLAPDCFRGLEKLTYLDLQNNQLEQLHSDVFAYLAALQHLNLAGNRLHVVSNELFDDNWNLITLNMQSNQLETLGEYAFQNQQRLKLIDVSHNPRLQSLVANMHTENLWAKNCSLNRVNIYGKAINVDLQQNHLMELYFSDPETLQTLTVRDNSLEQIASLGRVQQLRSLDLSNNPGLSTLPTNWEADKLQRLDLSNTTMKTIPINIIYQLKHLSWLNVSANQIKSINPQNFKYFQNLKQFYIHNNNWNCYNLKMLMEFVIEPNRMSYVHDDYDEEFPGEYIAGIKCMYRIDNEQEQDSDDVQKEESSLAASIKIPELLRSNSETSSNEGDTNDSLRVELQNQRKELKAIVGFYEEKFRVVMAKLNDLDARVREFEKLNETIWSDVAIRV